MKHILLIFTVFILFTQCETANHNNSKNSRVEERLPRKLFPFIENGKWGYINRKGKVVIPAKYLNVGHFNKGFAPVREKAFFFYIDTLGKRINDWKFEYAESFGDSVAFVWLDEGRKNAINSRFEFCDIEPLEYQKKGNEDYDYENPQFKFTWKIQRKELPEDSIRENKLRRTAFIQFVDSKGEVRLENKHWKDATFMNNNRAFVELDDNKWYLINENGKLVSNYAFDRYCVEGKTKDYRKVFQSDYQFVEFEDSIKLIDLNGQFVQIPEEFDEDIVDFNWIKNLVFFSKRIYASKYNSKEKYGFWDMDSKKLISPTFSWIIQKDFRDSLVYAEKGDTSCYVNINGAIVWEEKIPERDTNNLEFLNIDYRRESEYRVHSPDKRKYRNLGGWADSKNSYVSISNEFSNIAGVELIIDTMTSGCFQRYYVGKKAYLINKQIDTVFFEALDSRISITLQAFYNGEWHDIESKPRSSCGNSYHTVYLPKNHFWELDIPVYSGGFETQIRAKFSYKEDYNKDDYIVRYSNSFKASINPAQLWRAFSYRFDNNIMSL